MLPLLNTVACENSKPGAPPAEWDITGAGDADIQGFSTEISVNAGQPIRFKVDTSAPSYTIGIYRTGWYQGLGARKIADVTPSAFRQNQPQCLSDVTTELYDCGTWAVSATWQVPATAVSGVYVALLTRPDNGSRSHITFVVRSDGSRSDVVFQTSDTSWQAYNDYGGSDFYQGAQNGRAYKISYNRPVNTRGAMAGRDFYFSNEYPLVRFLEKNGYDVSYISGVDTDRNGAQLLNHKVFLSVGHDEYWSGAQRANVEAARDAGVNLQFLSGNEVYWRTRMEPSPVDGAAGRTITSYKETWANGKIDPSTEWTGTWRDPRYAAQANGGGLPENALTGTMYVSNYTDLPITVSAAEGKARLWRNTSLATLAAGNSAQLAPHTVGYESNEDLDNGFRPAGLIRLSTTTGTTPQYLQDFGNAVLPGTTTHNTTLYRAASGALVFSAGTVQWTWGLDQEHDGDGAAADPRMQQAQINLLADMGAQPATRDTALSAASASSDTAGPTVTVSSPAEGATIPHGTSVTVTGTASDTGGIVAGVEVSTDGGSSWHPAQGKQNWSYTYIQKGLATASIQVRAVDDSANIGAPFTRQLQLTGPYSVFGQQVPAVPDSGDGGAYELGMNFTPSVDGFVTGTRFYKSTANTGTHSGSLWNSAGQRLATATFTAETPSGWQEVRFSQPVPVAAGQQYVISYTAPKGHYASKDFQWASFGLTDPPLTVAGGFGSPPAGVYATPGSFPSTSFSNGNYFVDALFDTVDTSDLTAAGHWPLDGSSSVPQGTTVGAVFSKAVTASSVQLTLSANGTAVTGSTGYDPATRKVTFTPAAGLDLGTTYSVTLSASDAAGGSLTSGAAWSFTTVVSPPVPGSCPCSLYDDAVVPGIQEARDGVPLTLGVRFSSIAAGTVTGVRFYKSAGNTGTHTGTLFTASGQQLATVTFANESTSGWQTANFNQPVSITANTEYVMAYKSTTGSYSATVNGFGPGLSVGNLRTGSDAGAYSYTNDFPGNRSNASYLVDVVVQYPDPPFAAGAQAPLPGSSSVALDATVSAALSKPPAGSGVVMTLTGPDSGDVPGTASYDGLTGRATFTPTAPLSPATNYTATLTATSATGQTLSGGGTWTFTTVPVPRTEGVCPCSLYQDTVTPGVAEFNDGVPLTLGVRFASDSPGKVTGIRYYKSAGNTGTHTGGLYTVAGAAIGGRHLHRGILRRVADSRLQPAGGHRREHRIRGRLPHPHRGLFGDAGRFGIRSHQRTAADGTRRGGVHIQRRLPVIILERKLPRGRGLRRVGAAARRDRTGAGNGLPGLSAELETVRDVLGASADRLHLWFVGQWCRRRRVLRPLGGRPDDHVLPGSTSAGSHRDHRQRQQCGVHSRRRAGTAQLAVHDLGRHRRRTVFVRIPAPVDAGRDRGQFIHRARHRLLGVGCRQCHGRQVLQGRRQHRNTCRFAVDCRRGATCPGDVHERDRHRLADGLAVGSRRAPAGTGICRVLSGPQRQLSLHRGVLRRTLDQRCPDGAGPAQRALPVRLRRHCPDELLELHQLLRRRRLRPGRPLTSIRCSVTALMSRDNGSYGAIDGYWGLPGR